MRGRTKATQKLSRLCPTTTGSRSWRRSSMSREFRSPCTRPCCFPAATWRRRDCTGSRQKGHRGRIRRDRPAGPDERQPRDGLRDGGGRHGIDRGELLPRSDRACTKRSAPTAAPSGSAAGSRSICPRCLWTAPTAGESGNRPPHSRSCPPESRSRCAAGRRKEPSSVLWVARPNLFDRVSEQGGAHPGTHGQRVPQRDKSHGGTLWPCHPDHQFLRAQRRISGQGRAHGFRARAASPARPRGVRKIDTRRSTTCAA